MKDDPKAPANPADEATPAAPELAADAPEADADEAEAEADAEPVEAPRASRVPLPPATGELALRISTALHAKLMHVARDEGVTVEALVGELLAEGVTLRAWEILERKQTMRGQGQGQPQQGGARPFSGNQRHGNDRRHTGGGHPGGHRPYTNNTGGKDNRRQNNAWMEDKAAFLEYVRNQEKKSRR